MKVPTAILDILTNATTDGTSLHLTGPQLDPKLYKRVAEVIEGAGGRWDTTAQVHVFPGNAAEAIAPVLDSGHVTTLREARQLTQYFPTPPAVVARLIELARLEPGMKVLEPSAGRGAIAKAAAGHGAMVDCIEQDPDHAAELQCVGVARAVEVGDFLTVRPAPQYDRVVMNPPFTQGADITHVTHALRFLKPDGLLVAVMSWAVTFGGGAAAEFRALVERHGGTVEALPDGAFAESGTGVSTVLVTIPATRPVDAEPVVWPRRETAAPAEEEFGDPAVIAAEIAADLRKALDIFDVLARDLARPTSACPTRKPVVTVVSCLPEQRGQLAFDLLDEPT